ncbi:hypothetical protein KCU67_g75, partial [Aureobasidium melanogenum]
MSGRQGLLSGLLWITSRSGKQVLYIYTSYSSAVAPLLATSIIQATTQSEVSSNPRLSRCVLKSLRSYIWREARYPSPSMHGLPDLTSLSQEYMPILLMRTID